MANINLIKHSLQKLQDTGVFRRPEKNADVSSSGTFEIRDAVLIFTNFAGQANQWGNNSKYFNLVLTPEMLELLTSKEFNIRGQHLNVKIHQYPSDEELKLIKEQTGEEIPPLYYVNVKINMDSEYPPTVRLFTEKQITKNDGSVSTEKSQSILTDVTIATLDRATLEKIDCTISLRESKASKGYAVCYLQKLYAKQVVIPAYGGEWDDWDDPIIPEQPEEAK